MTMKIFVLTPIGDAISSSPSNSNTLETRILYYLRRHGKQASDTAICDHLAINGNQLGNAIRELEKNQAVKTVVSN